MFLRIKHSLITILILLFAISLSSCQEETFKASVIILPVESNVVTEDGQQSHYSISLASKPSSQVRVFIKTRDSSEGLLKLPESNEEPTEIVSILFNSENWSKKRIISVVGQDDNISDGDVSFEISVFKLQTADDRYDIFVPLTTELINKDNNAFGIRVQSANLLVTSEEGTEAQFSVVLISEPSSLVTLPIRLSEAGEASLILDSAEPGDEGSTSANLVFNSENWDTPRTVTVRGKDDENNDGDQDYLIILDPVLTDDEKYFEMNPGDIPAINLDDDNLGINIRAPENLIISEDGVMAEIEVNLNTQPDGDVVLYFESSNPAEAQLKHKLNTGPFSSFDEITFTEADWNSVKRILIRGISDRVKDGDKNISVNFDIDRDKTKDTIGFAAYELPNKSFEFTVQDSVSETYNQLNRKRYQPKVLLELFDFPFTDSIQSNDAFYQIRNLVPSIDYRISIGLGNGELEAEVLELIDQSPAIFRNTIKKVEAQEKSIDFIVTSSPNGDIAFKLKPITTSNNEIQIDVFRFTAGENNEGTEEIPVSLSYEVNQISFNGYANQGYSYYKLGNMNRRRNYVLQIEQTSDLAITDNFQVSDCEVLTMIDNQKFACFFSPANAGETFLRVANYFENQQLSYQIFVTEFDGNGAIGSETSPQIISSNNLDNNSSRTNLDSSYFQATGLKENTLYNFFAELISSSTTETPDTVFVSSTNMMIHRGVRIPDCVAINHDGNDCILRSDSSGKINYLVATRNALNGSRFRLRVSEYLGHVPQGNLETPQIFDFAELNSITFPIGSIENFYQVSNLSPEQLYYVEATGDDVNITTYPNAEWLAQEKQSCHSPIELNPIICKVLSSESGEIWLRVNDTKESSNANVTLSVNPYDGKSSEGNLETPVNLLFGADTGYLGATSSDEEGSIYRLSELVAEDAESGFLIYLDNFSGPVTMDVYSEDGVLRCQSFSELLSVVSCNVAPGTGGNLVLTIKTQKVTGIEYQINFAEYAGEDSVGSPEARVEPQAITDQPNQFIGTVDTQQSFYKLTGLDADRDYQFNFSGATDRVYLSTLQCVPLLCNLDDPLIPGGLKSLVVTPDADGNVFFEANGLNTLSGAKFNITIL